MRVRRLAIFGALCLAGACSAPRMMTAANEPESPVPPGAARVIFFRDALFGSAIPVYLYDISAQEPEFLGALVNGAKIAVDGAPGRHLFMLASDSADFLAAEVALGKVYAVNVTPNMGFLAASLDIRPLHAPFSDGDASTIATVPLLRKDDAAERWNAEHFGEALRWMASFQTRWSRLTEEERGARTLSPEDGG